MRKRWLCCCRREGDLVVDVDVGETGSGGAPFGLHASKCFRSCFLRGKNKGRLKKI